MRIYVIYSWLATVICNALVKLKGQTSYAIFTRAQVKNGMYHVTYIYIEAYTVYLVADKEGSVMPSIKTSSNDTV